MEVVNLAELAAAAEPNVPGDPFAHLDGCSLGVSRFSRHPRWEIHPGGDEFLQVVDGELDVILLTDDNPRVVLGPGDVFVVPQGVWHSPIPHGTVSLLSIGNYEGTRVSDEDDPRDIEPG